MAAGPTVQIIFTHCQTVGLTQMKRMVREAQCSQKRLKEQPQWNPELLQVIQPTTYYKLPKNKTF